MSGNKSGGGMNAEELRWWHKWSPEFTAGRGRGDQSGCLWHSLHLGGAERYSEHFCKSGQYLLLWTQESGQRQSTEVWLQLLGSFHLQLKRIKLHSLARTKPQRSLPALPSHTHHGCIATSIWLQEIALGLDFTDLESHCPPHSPAGQVPRGWDNLVT